MREKNKNMRDVKESKDTTKRREKTSGIRTTRRERKIVTRRRRYMKRSQLDMSDFLIFKSLSLFP